VAFTLIEVLVVIAIISVLAAMIIPISGAVNRNKIKTKARAELEQIATAIELYKAKLGHYPPDNPLNPATNQLYFELLGTTISNNVYTTLDGSAQINTNSIQRYFANVGGFINFSQNTAGDEGRVASPFLAGLKPGQVAVIGPNSGGSSSRGDLVKVLVSSIPPPLGQLYPVRYVSSSPTNNPNSYDLWVDILISGKTNRFNNWNKEAITLP
jgi:prepilin-type N-terminal cleavage/methylation domain-containing protein